MAIKHGSTTITVVKHGTASISTVYHGGTKVFPDATYTELSMELYVDTQEGSVWVDVYNPNSFDVDVYCDWQIETSTDVLEFDDNFTLEAGTHDYWWLWNNSGQDINWVYVICDISGGGYSWQQELEY